jgi:hypothetical protein
MLAITQDILKEQVKLKGKKPVFDLTINDYDFPDKPTAVRPNYFNWKCIWTGEHDWWVYMKGINEGTRAYNPNHQTDYDWPAGYFTDGIGPGVVGLYWAPAVCATKNGTLIFWDKVTGYHRFENPTEGTDFTDWIPSQDLEQEEHNPPSYFPTAECIVANPLNDEVIKFDIPSSLLTVRYYVSIDDGVTFGGAQYLADIPAPIQINGVFGLWVRVAYKSNGDLCVMVITSKGDLSPSINYYLWVITRESGVWGSWSNALEISATGSTGCYFPAMGSPDQDRRTGMTSAEIAYAPLGTAGDWIIMYSWEAGVGNVSVKNRWVVRGDGGAIDKGVWFKGTGQPNISTAYQVINSFSDIQHFSASGYNTGEFSSGWENEMNTIERDTTEVVPLMTAADAANNIAANRWAERGGFGPGVTGYGMHTYSQFENNGWQVSGTSYIKTARYAKLETNRLFEQLFKAGGVTVTKDLQGRYSATNIQELYAYNSIFQIPGGELIWCVQADDQMYFFALRHDMTVKEAVFYKAYSLESKYPMQIVCTGNYIFGISNYKIFMSVIPDEWAVPTIGTGVGAACTMPSDTRILSFSEAVEGDAPGTLTIDLDNHDGYFDSPGSGNLANLKKGSRVSLYMGFKISSTNTTSECRRYFVDDWGFGREPNRSIFKLICSDGWKLLDEYIINSQVMYNEFTEEYSSYEIIEMLVNSIGGTVYGTDASTAINNNYPMVNIQAGTPAGQVVRALLKETSDMIRWFGNDAHIINCQTTDSPVYDYIFPKTS